MKTRSGFVSNSSTSSFVCVMPMDDFNEVMDGLHPYVQAVVNALGPNAGKMGEMDVVSLYYFYEIGGGDGTLSYTSVEYDGKKPMYKEEYAKEESEMDLYGAVEAFEKAVKESGHALCLRVGT